MITNASLQLARAVSQDVRVRRRGRGTLRSRDLVVRRGCLASQVMLRMSLRHASPCSGQNALTVVPVSVAGDTPPVRQLTELVPAACRSDRA